MSENNFAEALFDGSSFYLQVLKMLEQELFSMAQKFEWPPEWLSPPEKWEAGVKDWLDRIEEFAAGQSERAAQISAVGRLSQIAVMTLLSLSQITKDGAFIESLSSLAVGTYVN